MKQAPVILPDFSLASGFGTINDTIWIENAISKYVT